MDQLLSSLQNKKHTQMPIIILPCVCCLKKLLSLQNDEENECSCDNEEKREKHKNETKKHHHHHHHKHINKESDDNEKKKKEKEVIEKKKKRKHSTSNQCEEENKNKKNKTHDKKDKRKEKEVKESSVDSSLSLPSNSNKDSDNNKVGEKVIEIEEENGDKNNEENNEENNGEDNDNEFKIKKPEFRLRISKPTWIPPRVKYGERIDDNSKPKKKRKPRKKQQQNDIEYIEKNRNSISFTPAVEKKKEPYFKLQSVESEYESIDNPLIGDKIQFKLFDCEMEGDEMSFPSFSESDPMIGDVVGKNIVDEVEHIVMKLENGETNTV